MKVKYHILSLLAAVTAFTGCRSESGYATADGLMLGTTYHIVARGPLAADALRDLALDVDAEMKSSMSIFDPASRLSRINTGQTDTLDAHLLRNIALAGHINRISGGAYDITVKPLTDAYGFAARTAAEHPDIDSIMEFVGFDKFAVENCADGTARLVRSDPRLQIDLNSIAKGYTVDVLAGRIESAGCRDYIVEVGGEIRACGISPRGDAWRVAVDSPFEGNLSPGQYRQSVVEIGDGALATSGNYRRYRTDAEGGRITHTIDPRTGASVSSRLLSATVICRRCIEADALATMFMAMGAERACALAEQMRDSVQVYFVLAPESGGGTADDAGRFEVFSTLDRDNQ